MQAIVCVDSKMGIGKDGAIPWKNFTDLQHFREKTMGNVVVMGGSTFRSLPGPLKGRTCLVLTRSPLQDVQYDAAQVEFFDDIDNLLQSIRECLKVSRVFLAGLYSNKTDEMIREKLMDMCTVLHLTRLDKDYNCDTYFTPFGIWHQESSKSFLTNDCTFTIDRYSRV